MLSYIIRRLIFMIPTLFLISIISFVVIELPPGDYLSYYIATLMEKGEAVDPAVIKAMAEHYGLNDPEYIRYFKWMGGILHGDFGQSFAYGMPVGKLIAEKLPLTATIALLSTVFTMALGWPIGFIAALKKYTWFDYLATVIGYIGMSVPGFLMALILMWLIYINTGVAVVGLFSPQYLFAHWDWAKLVDFLKHIWLAVFVLAIGGTAGTIRVIRALMLDELGKPYVTTARAKGLSETRTILKYPARIALNPVWGSIGGLLPAMISGEALTSIVLSMDTTGPVMLRALLEQDMFLAGSLVMMVSFLSVIGMLISDIVLAISDPRIRYT